MKFKDLPGCKPSPIGFVKFEVECLHNSMLSQRAMDYNHRDIKLWLTAHLDLDYKDSTTFNIAEQAIYVRNGTKKGYKITPIIYHTVEIPEEFREKYQYD